MGGEGDSYHCQVLTTLKLLNIYHISSISFLKIGGSCVLAGPFLLSTPPYGAGL